MVKGPLAIPVRAKLAEALPEPLALMVAVFGVALLPVCGVN
jgi:hypothetical protein